LVSTLTKASTTLTMLAILIVGIVLFAHGQTTVGGIVMFMSFAGMLTQRLEQAARFANRLFMDAPRLQEFFSVLDTAQGPRDRKRAVTLRAVRGPVAFERVTFTYDGRKAAALTSPSPQSPMPPTPTSGRRSSARRPPSLSRAMRAGLTRLLMSGAGRSQAASASVSRLPARCLRIRQF
jgi:ABC-type multidrug transport system fused ATPase/permease subunit